MKYYVKLIASYYKRGIHRIEGPFPTEQTAKDFAISQNDRYLIYHK